MDLGSHGSAPWLEDHQLDVGPLESLEDSSCRPVCLGGWKREKGQFYVGWTFWEANHGVSLKGKHVGRCVGGGEHGLVGGRG